MISLLKSTTVAKVNTGWADKLAGDRLQNPSEQFCPVWSGKDSFGRAVCVDSYYTKTPGCASAEDRVVVENQLRPFYAEYVGLDAQGYTSPYMIGMPVDPRTQTMHANANAAQMQDNMNVSNIVGSAGYQTSNNNTVRTTGIQGVRGPNADTMISGCSGNQCGAYSNQRVIEGYTDRVSNMNFQNRRNNSAIQGWKSQCNSCGGGGR